MPRKKVQGILQEYIETVQKPNVDFSIANVLLNRIDSLSEMNIEEIAFLAHTTPSTVTKFVQKLGYKSLKELKEDKEQYTDSFIGDGFSYQNEIDFFSSVYQFEQNFDQTIIQLLDLNLIQELAQKIQTSKNICILQGKYNHNIVSFLTEIINQQENKTVYSLYRGNNTDFLLQTIQKCDLVILTSLSGKYLKEREEFLNRIPCDFYIISTTSYAPYNCINPNQEDIIFQSYYTSQRYLYIVFFLILYYLQNSHFPKLENELK